MTKLLLNEAPLVILPSLAKSIGLNGAIFLQQVHYWLGKAKTEFNQSKWVYKTLEEWVKEFPFWSEATIKRVIKMLKEKSLLKIEKLSKSRTNYYTLDYEKLEDLTGQDEPMQEVNVTQSLAQSEPKEEVNVNQSTAQNDPLPIYNENQETTTETTSKNTAEIKKYKKSSRSKKVSWEELGEIEKNEAREEIRKIEDSKVLSLEEFEDSLIAKGYEYANFVTAYKVWVKRGEKNSFKNAKPNKEPKKDLLNNIPTEFKISEDW